MPTSVEELFDNVEGIKNICDIPIKWTYKFNNKFGREKGIYVITITSDIESIKCRTIGMDDFDLMEISKWINRRPHLTILLKTIILRKR